MNSSPSPIINNKKIQALQQNLVSVYAKSSIFVAKQSKGIFQSCVSFGSNCPSIQIPFTQDYLYRILYYFILYYSFESGEPHSEILIDSLTKILVKYKGGFHCPSSFKTSKLKLSVQEIHQYYFDFLYFVRSSIQKKKLVKIINTGIYIDYVFMQIMHTLVGHYRSISTFLQEIGINIHIFKQQQILLDGFVIKFNRIQQDITFKIQRQTHYRGLISNQNIDLCQSIGTVEQSIISNKNQEAQNKNFYGFLGTARHVNSFYNQKVSQNNQSSGLYNQNDVSLSQLTQVIGSIEKIQSPPAERVLINENSYLYKKQLNPESPYAFDLSRRRVKSQNNAQITPFNVSISKIKSNKKPDQENCSVYLHPIYQSNQQSQTIKKPRRRKLSDHTSTPTKSFCKKQFQFVRAINQIFIPTNPRQIMQSPKKSISTMKTSIEKSQFNNKIQTSFCLSINVPLNDLTRQLPSFSENLYTPSNKIKIIKDFFKKNKQTNEKG